MCFSAEEKGFFFSFSFLKSPNHDALSHSELLNLHDRPLYSEVTFWGAYLPLPTAVLSDALGTGTRGQVPDDVPPARADCLCLRLQVWGPAPPGPASFKVGVGGRGGARFRVVFNVGRRRPLN